jgi:hypothetical protein
MDVPNRSDIVREGMRNRSESVDQLQQRPKLGFLDKPQDTTSRQASANSILNSYSDISTPKGVTATEIRSRMSLGKILITMNRCLNHPLSCSLTQTPLYKNFF